MRAVKAEPHADAAETNVLDVRDIAAAELMALAEFPRLCSPKFPTLRR